MKEMIPVHWLSKEARRRIIDIMLSTRSIHQLAEEIGISPTAIRKYINRTTHPSDDTMYRIFGILAPYEEEQIMRIVIDDLVDALNHLAKSINDDRQKKYLINKLKEVLARIER